MPLQKILVAASVVLLLPLPGSGAALASPAAPSPSGPTAPDSTSTALADELVRVAAQLSPVGSFHLLVECRWREGTPTLELWSDGIGLWEERRQFQLPDGGMEAIIRRLLNSDFAHLRPAASGQVAPTTCLVDLHLNGLHRRVAQYAGGQPADGLREVAYEIIGLCQPLGEDGLAISNVTHGLKKLASGKLEPRFFRMDFRLRAAGGASDLDAEPGSRPVHLRLEGTTATAAPWPSDTANGPSYVLELETPELRELAGGWAELKLGSWPASLPWPADADLSFHLLGRVWRMAAREGGNPETELPKKVRRHIETFVEQAADLHRRVMAEGTAIAAPPVP